VRDIEVQLTARSGAFVCLAKTQEVAAQYGVMLHHQGAIARILSRVVVDSIRVVVVGTERTSLGVDIVK